MSRGRFRPPARRRTPSLPSPPPGRSPPPKMLAPSAPCCPSRQPGGQRGGGRPPQPPSQPPPPPMLQPATGLPRTQPHAHDRAARRCAPRPPYHVALRPPPTAHTQHTDRGHAHNWRGRHTRAAALGCRRKRKKNKAATGDWLVQKTEPPPARVATTLSKVPPGPLSSRSTDGPCFFPCSSHTCSDTPH